MDELEQLTKLTDGEVESVKVANATTRPNASGFYGGGGLDSAGVKAIFDKYPEKLRSKLNDVIVFANALLSALNDDSDRITSAETNLSSLETNLNSLAERVGDEEVSKDPRFTSNALASAILKLSEDLGGGAELDKDNSLYEIVQRKVSTVSYDPSGAVISFKDGGGNTVASVDLPLESMFKGAQFVDGKLVLTLFDGQTLTIENDVIAERIADLSGDVLKSVSFDDMSSSIVLTKENGEAFRVHIPAKAAIGAVDTALDRILEIQEYLIGDTYDSIIEEQEEILDLQNDLIGGTE